MAITLLTGCATPDPIVPSVPGATVRDLGDAWEYTWATWPKGAEHVQISFSCECPGKEGKFNGSASATWQGDPGGTVSPGPSSNGARQGAEMFDFALLQDRAVPGVTPISSSSVWIDWAVGIGLTYPMSVAADVGVGPGREISFGNFGASGNFSAAFTQPEYRLLLGGPEFHLHLIATNQTGSRINEDLHLVMSLPKDAIVTATASRDTTRLAADEPVLGGGRGQAVDLTFPQRASYRSFPVSSQAVESSGTLRFIVTPWTRSDGTATYNVQAPDFTLRARQDLAGGESTFSCLDACNGLGGTYALNGGFAPAGTTTFTIEGATCQGESGCNGIIIAADLGTTPMPDPWPTVPVA